MNDVSNPPAGSNEPNQWAPPTQPPAMPATPPAAPAPSVGGSGPWAPPSGLVPPPPAQQPPTQQAPFRPAPPQQPTYPQPAYAAPSTPPFAPPPAVPGPGGPQFPPTPPTYGAAPAPSGEPKRRGSGRSALVGGLVGAIVAALVATGMWFALPEKNGTTNVVTQVRPSATLDAGKGLDVQGLLTKVRPSVVSIQTGTTEGEAAGSGIILSEDGLVLTNAHVVADATSVEVHLSDGSSHAADIVGSFPNNDVALVKARGVSGLTPAELGESEKLLVGDDVVAIGNALNLGAQPTVTKGIVSALDRTISAPGVSLEHLIQTDAAINPGNSGGPLINSTGQVVGINTALIPDSQNLGFSLAIDQIKAGKGEINADTPFLGVSTTDVAEQRAEILDRFGIDVEAGAFVASVVDGSTAAEAGLEPGDVIISINGHEVKTKEDVGAVVRASKPGEKVEVTYLREGEEHTGSAELGRRGN